MRGRRRVRRSTVAPVTLRPLLAFVAAASVLAACGGDDDTTTPATSAPGAAITVPAPTTPATTAAPTTPPTTVAPTTAAPTTAAPTTVAPTTAPTTAPPTTAAPDPLATLATLLLTTDELNAVSGDVEFVDLGWRNEPSESPCGGPGVDAAFPPNFEVGTTLGTQDVGVGMIEQILVYPSSEVAGEALAHGMSMFECGTTPDGFTFEAPVDVTFEVTTDPEVPDEADYSISAIEYTGDGMVGALWITRFNDSLVVFQFVRATDFPIETLPVLPADIVSMGLSKVFEFVS